MENTYGYFAKNVASNLDITTSTLRRWSIALEKNGYLFERNQKDRRIYFERDFAALRELKKLLANGVSFTDAIKSVTAMNFETKNGKQTPIVHDQKTHLSKRELEEIINEVARRTAEETAQAMEEKFNNEIEKRDRVAKEEIKKLSEQRELAAAKETPTKKWWEFWK